MKSTLIIPLISLFVGALLQCIRLIPEPVRARIESKPTVRWSIFVASVLLILYGVVDGARLLVKEDTPKIFVSPTQVTIDGQTTRLLKIKVTNNNDFPVFDVRISACFDKNIVDRPLVEFIPVQADLMPIGGMFFFVYSGEHDRCVSPTFYGISAHDTADFEVKIGADHIERDFLVAFDVEEWLKTPKSKAITKRNHRPSTHPENEAP